MQPLDPILAREGITARHWYARFDREHPCPVCSSPAHTDWGSATYPITRCTECAWTGSPVERTDLREPRREALSHIDRDLPPF